MKILIVETQSKGHYPEYLKHVIRWVIKNDLIDDYLFYLTGGLRTSLTEFENTTIKSSICFFDKSIDDELLKTNNLARFIVNRVNEMNSQFGVKEVVFLNINLVLRYPGFLFSNKKFPFLFKGIFFQSPYRLRTSGTQFLKRLKREIAIYCLAKNKNCNGIFLLNDVEGADFYSKWSSKIKNIEDPVHVILEECMNIRKYHSISNDRKVILHIGSLSEIKGTLDVIDTMTRLANSAIANKYYFLFVGNSTEVIVEKMNNIKGIISTDNYLFRNEYVKDCEFISYIKQSDVVMITNNNIETSSGILNHAMYNFKLVIAPNKGYFQEKLSNYSNKLLFNNKSDIFKLLDNSKLFENHLENTMLYNQAVSAEKVDDVTRFCEALLFRK